MAKKFQSPRSGKFVSDMWDEISIDEADYYSMVSIPQIGEICIRSDAIYGADMLFTTVGFQSPRSGKFVSDQAMLLKLSELQMCFNPLDRGNLYQIRTSQISSIVLAATVGFNPLDRGNLYQMCQHCRHQSFILCLRRFQSPRSGKFVSDRIEVKEMKGGTATFQSPRSGKFVSDLLCTIRVLS